ncbi:hypothetical protein ZWY2020_054968 [Hordeum vulgare]|nr:hypothetical protein ZWY2020_054968 [Hordeum vulgare]
MVSSSHSQSGGDGCTAAAVREVATARFARQVVLGRWFMVFACLLILSASGATYIFGLYSKVLKSALGYDQQTLNTFAFFKDLGANAGVLSGLINEVTPPWVVLAMGAAMNLVGYLMIYLAIDGRTSRPPVWLMCVYICVGANSQSFANTGALVTCVKNFLESRGVVLGLLKGFVGLSGAIFTQLYIAIYGDDAKSVVLLVAWLPAAVSILFVHTVRIMPHRPVRRGEDETAATTSNPFYCFLYISMALATYLLVMIVVQNQMELSHPALVVSATALMLILLLPLAVVVKQEYRIKRELEESLLVPPTVAVEKPPAAAPLQMAAKAETEEAPATKAEDAATPASGGCFGSCLKEMFSPPAQGEDYTILQALVSVDMLVLFLATICGVGGTLTAIDNMGQIGQSLGYPAKSITTFISLISIWNYAGRVTAGFASEAVLARYKFPRPLMLTLVLLLACIGHLLIAFGVRQSLYAASVVIGFCFGAQWPLLLAIISEVFGLKYYSTLYNFGSVASPIGAYALNVRVAGYLYDVEAARQHGGTLDGAGDKTCIGVQCFKLAFLIITAATFAGALVSLVLVWRTRKFYRSDMYAKFRTPTVSQVRSTGGRRVQWLTRASPVNRGKELRVNYCRSFT